jgi:hypothetical protein
VPDWRFAPKASSAFVSLFLCVRFFLAAHQRIDRLRTRPMNTHHLLQTLERRLGLGADAASERKRRILKHVAERTVVSRDMSETTGAEKDSLGVWLADKVAEFGGSWTFIMMFVAFLVSWAILNTIILVTGALDPIRSSS